MATVFDVIGKPRRVMGGQAILADDRERLVGSSLEGRTRALASALATHGVSRGNRVLIALPNSVDWVIGTLAVMRLGAIAAPIDPDAVDREIRGFENIIEPCGVLTRGGAASEQRFRCRLLPTSSPIEDPGEDGLPPRPSSDDPALILFTSGTTGFPKAAVQAHRVLVYAGQGVAHWLDLTSADRLLLCMPLFHANAIYYSLMGALCADAGLFIAPRFSASRFWETARTTGATEVNLMGPMIAMLLKQPPKADDLEHSLRLVYTAAVRRNDAEEFTRRFGAEIVEGYGLTETPYGSINARGVPRWGSIGRPRQHPTGAITNELRVADESGGRVPDGENGEIQIRNGATFEKYWANPTASSAAFMDGWLRTGDIGYRDRDGFFYIVGRAKEIIRRKGVNIAPAEIESVMKEIHYIDEAALIGLPSPLGEELAIAVVTLKKGESWDGAEKRILNHLQGLVSREKMPDRVVIVAELPKTSTHRVQKATLKEWLQHNGAPQAQAEHR